MFLILVYSFIMYLKNFFIYALMLFSLCGNTMAMDNSHDDDNKILIIGCRPWDPNIQNVKGLGTASFVDFRSEEGPNPLPPHFHPLDLNDLGIYGAQKFSEFAAANPNKYTTILLDWATQHHIRRAEAWADCAALLKVGGKLVIPVSGINIFTGKSISKEKAQELIDSKLNGKFANINTSTYETMPGDAYLNLLRREEFAWIAPEVPTIIFATK